LEIPKTIRTCFIFGFFQKIYGVNFKAEIFSPYKFFLFQKLYGLKIY
jgi:hypothetical protein